HADYALLHQHFGESDVMIFLRDLATKAAQDIESIAYAITRKKASEPSVNYKAELRAVQFEMQELAQPGPRQASQEALTL
ncbi:FUSC family membrane protein, partial [Acinetobacter baumannii]